MTRLFAPRADRRPRVFALPPGVDYAAAFAAGLAHRLDGHPPEAAARVDLLVNSTRARRTIEDALARRAGGAACFLPRITLTESALADPPPGLGPPGEAEPVCPLMRRLALTRLVERYADAGEIPRTAAPDLAQSLAELIDLMDEEGVDPALLDGAVAAEMAEHWQRSLAFLSIVREQWPALRETLAPGRLDPMAGEAARAGRLAAHWATHPPAHPVIAAGSTGARAVIATVLEAVATLDQGAVVLPGFDPSIDPDIWARAGDDHPMAPFRRLLDRLGIEPADVEPWDPAAPCPLRLDLLTEAMRPAPVTDAWIARRDDLARQAPTATAGVELIEAPHPRLEAEAIALAVREALETPGRTVAIVTRDASLARRVTAALARYAVLPDDSLGRPLALTPPAIFAELVLRVARAAAASRPDPVSLAALLAHPFARAGHPRRHHRRLARRFERRVLRGVRPVGRPGAVLPPWPDDPRHPPEPEDLAWAAAVEAMLAPLIAALRGGAALGDLIAAHVAAIAALSAPVGAPSRADAAKPAAIEAEDTHSPREGAAGMAFRDQMAAHGSADDAYAA
ncbi:MAG: double-strand break repair protein AddB, partial [Paracoccaceae bacterium]